MILRKEILQKEIRFETTRSRGPGGQHVNRTESAVILRWCLWATGAFSLEQHEVLLKKLSHNLNSEGEIVLRSDEFRSQLENKKCCEEKFFALLEKALFVPKKRIKTKPTYSSKVQRLSAKKRDSDKKKLRGKIKLD